MIDRDLMRGERRLALILLIGCCVILAGWTVILGMTLPRHFNIHHWRLVWVGFDLFLTVAFVTVAWAAWRERQVLILLLMVVGTMLCCDAWFDVGTSLRTGGAGLSLTSAVFAEVPLAVLAFAGARRLLAATVAARVATAQRAGTGADSRRVRLRHAPLSGAGLDEALRRSHSAPRRAPAELRMTTPRAPILPLMSGSPPSPYMSEKGSLVEKAPNPAPFSTRSTFLT